MTTQDWVKTCVLTSRSHINNFPASGGPLIITQHNVYALRKCDWEFILIHCAVLSQKHTHGQEQHEFLPALHTHVLLGAKFAPARKPEFNNSSAFAAFFIHWRRQLNYESCWSSWTEMHDQPSHSDLFKVRMYCQSYFGIPFISNRNRQGSEATTHFVPVLSSVQVKI